MTRIEKSFRRLRSAGEKGLIVYLTAGDPTPSVSLRYLRAAADAGADLLEVGVPFSDPTADGPTIEAASRRALSSGMNVKKTLDLVRRFRKTHVTPVILFGYYNPFFRYGWLSLCRDAKASGIDGMLIVDLPLEESREAIPALRKQGIDWIPLAAPTTSEERLKAIDAAGSGFLYLISVTGVTGVRDALPAGTAAWSRTVSRKTKLPIAVGFGISSPSMAKSAARSADAVVVGSACVKVVERYGRDPRGPAELSRFVRSVKTALR